MRTAPGTTDATALQKFREEIDAQLVIAAAELGRGTPAAKLYDALIKDGKAAPPREKKATQAPTKDSLSRDPASAKVTIQIFADLQCPFGKRVNATRADLDAAYPGELRFVWRNLPMPMHTRASLAAEAAMKAIAQKASPAFW